MQTKYMSSEDTNALYTETPTTIFCTHNKDGTIHAVPIWYQYKDETFYFMSFKDAKRIKNIQHNNDVSLSLVMPGGPGESTKIALINGKAEVGFEPEEGYDKFAQWIGEKYPSVTDNPDYNKFNHDRFVTIKVVPDKALAFHPC